MNKVNELAEQAIEKHNKYMEALRDNHEMINDLWKAVSHISFTTFDINSNSLDLFFTGKVEDLNTVWKALRARGYAPSDRPPADKRLSTFSTFWNHEERISIYMHFSSSQCKMIQTGTEMVEKPVYEVQCESELAELGV
jgi:hypothetical protein